MNSLFSLVSSLSPYYHPFEDDALSALAIHPPCCAVILWEIWWGKYEHRARAVILWEELGTESVRVKVEVKVAATVHVHATFSTFFETPLPRQQSLASLQTHYKTLRA